MAVHSTRTARTTRREWSVPVNTNHAEFLKAYSAAVAAYREAHNMAPDAGLWDDALWITSDGGAEVVIAFTIETDLPGEAS